MDAAPPDQAGDVDQGAEEEPGRADVAMQDLPVSLSSAKPVRVPVTYPDAIEFPSSYSIWGTFQPASGTVRAEDHLVIGLLSPHVAALRSENERYTLRHLAFGGLE